MKLFRGSQNEAESVQRQNCAKRRAPRQEEKRVFSMLWRRSPVKGARVSPLAACRRRPPGPKVVCDRLPAFRRAAFGPLDEDLRSGLVLLAPAGRGVGERHLVLDAALVVALLDPEVALLAPVGVPGVRHLPVLDAVLHTPADNLHRVPAGDLPRHVVVDPGNVVLEVRVHHKRGLDRAAGHDGVHDLLLAARGGHVAGEGELVVLEVLVRARALGVAGLRALRGALALAAGLALRGVRVAALRTVVVAVRQGEVRAEAPPEGAGSMVLSAGHRAVRLDVFPRRVDVTATATILAGAEADVLGREGYLVLGVRRDAEPIGGRLRR